MHKDPIVTEVKKIYHWNSSGQIIGEGIVSGSTVVQDWSVKYIYSGNTKMAMIQVKADGTEQTYYFVNNAQGSPALIADDSGAIVQKIQLDPYGNLELYQYADQRVNRDVYAINGGDLFWKGWEQEGDHGYGGGYSYKIGTSKDFFGYLHMDPNVSYVNVGDHISMGQKIGKYGNIYPNGWSSGSHIDVRHIVNGSTVFPGIFSPLRGSFDISTGYKVFDSMHSKATHPKGHGGIDYYAYQIFLNCSFFFVLYMFRSRKNAIY